MAVPTTLQTNNALRGIMDIVRDNAKQPQAGLVPQANTSLESVNMSPVAPIQYVLPKRNQKEKAVLSTNPLGVESQNERSVNPQPRTTGNSPFAGLSTKQRIFVSEGNSAEGEYGRVGDIGDGAGLSVGAYQFTEKSGGAHKLAKELGVNRNDYNTSVEYQQALSATLASDRGRIAQDKLFQKTYVKPVDAYMKRKGITDSRTRDFLVDTKVNGGYLNVITQAKNKQDYSYQGYVNNRKQRYAGLVADNPKKFAQYENGWGNRMKRWESLIQN